MVNTSIPAIDSLHDILFEEGMAKRFVLDNNIIRTMLHCGLCGKIVYANVSRESFRHKCLEYRDIEQSMWKYTFFSKVKLKVNEVLRIGYLYLCGCSHSTIAIMTGHSTKTITHFLAEFRQLFSDSIQESACVIGGENIIVEIDECKISKRKFNVGHYVEGAWVVGGVERTQERRLFLVRVERRDAESLENVISTYVRPGSIIHTDCWRGYGFLRDTDEVTHRTVNHSKHFKDPETGVHSNTIEGTWAAVKSSIAKRYRCGEGVEEHLKTFIWRRLNEKNLWESFLDALKKCQYIE